MAANDRVQVTIGAAAGATISPDNLNRLAKIIAVKIEDKKLENPPAPFAKQFLVAVEVQKYFAPDPNIPSETALDLMVDVRILPGGERVCRFGVGELAGPEMPPKALEVKAAMDTAKCISDPRMWIRPEPPPPPAVAP